MAKTPKHPLQPFVLCPDKVIRFKPNKIVRFLLDAGPFDMNKLALMEFPIEDREQFLQLIGYSFSGFGELSYVRDATYAEAKEANDAFIKERIKPRPKAVKKAAKKARKKK